MAVAAAAITVRPGPGSRESRDPGTESRDPGSTPRRITHNGT